jgi:hypothetical protein
MELLKVKAMIIVMFTAGFWAFVVSIDIYRDPTYKFAHALFPSALGSVFIFVGIIASVTLVIRHIR